MSARARRRTGAPERGRDHAAGRPRDVVGWWRGGRRAGQPRGVDTVVLTEIRAALSAGAAPGAALVAAVARHGSASGEALATRAPGPEAEPSIPAGRPGGGPSAATPEGGPWWPVARPEGAPSTRAVGPDAGPLSRQQGRDHPLAPVARAVRLGAPLAEAAATVDTGDHAADLLVRALGVVERAGAGAVTAVDQVIDAVRGETDLARLLRARVVQARGTAVVLTIVPTVVWVLLVVLDPAALRFYATPLGLVTGTAAVGLGACGQWWSRRLVRRAREAPAAADPLAPVAGRRDHARAVVLAVPAALILGIAVHPAAGLVAGLGGALLGVRRRDAGGAGVQGGAGPGPGGDAGGTGGAVEAVELVAIALSAGLSASEAAAVVAPLAPPRARAALAAGARRLRASWAPDAAFAGTGLAVLGTTLAATERWGAPAETALRRLAEDLRAERRAAGETAGERVQLALVFPTTLLTLPAFVLAVVPPTLWTAFAGAGGAGP